jgi:hypothetical protein
VSGNVGLLNIAAAQINPAKEDGNLATVSTGVTSLDGKVTACNTGAVAGSVTANAGTNLNTSALALETGGNLATAATKLTAIDGHITACNTGAIAGTVTVNAGTNLNTSALALETGGNLAAAASSVSSIDGHVTKCDSDNIQGKAPSYYRTTGGHVEVTAKASAGKLLWIIIGHGVAGKTVTVKDNATVIAILDASFAFPFPFAEVAFATSLKITPSDDALDVTAIFR